MNKYSEKFKFSEIMEPNKWVNRSLRFYLPARELFLRNYSAYYSAITILGFQSVESALKASLVLWDKSFDPIKCGHNTKKMFRIYQNKVPEDMRFLDRLHPYFEDYKRYQEHPRYPRRDIALLHVDPCYLDKLDLAYRGFVCAVPRTFWMTELEPILSGEALFKLKVFRRRNRQIRAVRRILGIKIGQNPRPRRVE